MRIDAEKLLNLLRSKSLSANEMTVLIYLGQHSKSLPLKSLQTVQLETKIPYASFYRAIKRLKKLDLISNENSDVDYRVKLLDFSISTKENIQK